MDECVNGNEVLDSFYHIAPYIKYFFDEEVSYAVTDKEKYILYQPTEHINPGIKSGDAINPSSGSGECIRIGSVGKKILDRSVLGVPMLAIAIPIKD